MASAIIEPEPVNTAATNFAAAMPPLANSARTTTFFDPWDIREGSALAAARVQLVPPAGRRHHRPFRATPERSPPLSQSKEPGPPEGFLFELPPRVRFLDEDGALVPGAKAVLPDDKTRELYRHMLRARLFDDRLLKLQRQGRIGTFAPSFGQEACQVGSMSALTKEDWF